MSFQQGLSGLDAASKDLDTIGNNVANASTVGFKQSVAQFADVFANSLTGAGGLQIGIGTKVSGVSQQFTQGNVTTSSNPLDIAINGGGFYRLSQGGVISYSRNGQFQLDRSGFITNAGGLRLTGYTANALGVLNTGVVTDLQVSTADLSPRATTELDELLNLDSRNGTLPAAGFNLNNPSTYHSTTSASVYDSLGNVHTLSTYFVKTAANTWSVFAALDGVQVGAGAVGVLTFNTNGSLVAAPPFVISAPVTTGATSPLVFNLDFTGSTQFGSNFGINRLVQDGYTSGRLAGFSIASDGLIQGRYSNGQTLTLGQILLANFSNPQGLQPLGNNLWTETASSGAALVGAPNTGTLGILQSSAVEDSNVDLTAELVNLITAQRVYQANAQTIKTQDAVLQTLVNIR